MDFLFFFFFLIIVYFLNSQKSPSLPSAALSWDGTAVTTLPLAGQELPVTIIPFSFVHKDFTKIP